MSTHRYNRLLSLALQPWALTRPMVSVVAHILARHLGPGERAEVETIIDKRPDAAPSRANGVAIIPLHGVIAPRANLFSDVSGTATFDQATADLREAVARADVGTIVLDWDSPGGSVAGATEFAREVLKARATKPIVSHANFEMCSAAYWTGACATEIVAAPSAMVGSIGVYSIHEDLSEALKLAGVKLTYIAAGKFKIDGNEAEPLSDSARARLKALVEASYARFVGDVAKGRGVSEAVIRSGYGEGTVVNADEALALGMVDRIETLDETVARLLSSAPPVLALRAQTPPPPAPPDPPHEPARATGHDRRATERREVERALLALGF